MIPIHKFTMHKYLLRKTVNRAHACYFKFGSHEHIEVKCTDEYILEFIYKPNRYRRFYINYDAKNDSLLKYFVDVQYPYNSFKFSAPQNQEAIYDLKKLCTEEGYFQQSTIQDLTELDRNVIIEFTQLIDEILRITRELRNDKTSTEV